MSKKLNYEKLISELSKFANPKRNLKIFWNCQFKDINHLDHKPGVINQKYKL